MSKTRKMKSTITIRLSEKLLEEVDKLVKERVSQRLGVSYTRADVIRDALLNEVSKHA